MAITDQVGTVTSRSGMKCPECYVYMWGFKTEGRKEDSWCLGEEDFWCPECDSLLSSKIISREDLLDSLEDNLMLSYPIVRRRKVEDPSAWAERVVKEYREKTDRPITVLVSGTAWWIDWHNSNVARMAGDLREYLNQQQSLNVSKLSEIVPTHMHLDVIYHCIEQGWVAFTSDSHLIISLIS